MTASAVWLVGLDCCDASVPSAVSMVRSMARAYYRNVPTISWIVDFSAVGRMSESSGLSASCGPRPEMGLFHACGACCGRAWLWVLELVECFLDVSWHRDVDGFCL